MFHEDISRQVKKNLRSRWLSKLKGIMSNLLKVENVLSKTKRKHFSPLWKLNQVELYKDGLLDD